jgi:hypothetical protein
MKDSTKVRPSPATVIALIALFVSLGGSAAALSGRNTVDSGDIINGEVRSSDIGTGMVRTGDVADDSTPTALTGVDVANGSLSGSDVGDGSLSGSDVGDGSLSGGDVGDGSLTGADIDEGSLGQVPSAALGGYGRSFSGNGCNPTSTTFVDCGFVTLSLPAQARVLITAVVRSYTPGGSNQFGFCRLATSNGVLNGTSVGAIQRDALALTAVTGPVGPGSVDFGIECNQEGADIAYEEVRVSAVALSSN